MELKRVANKLILKFPYDDELLTKVKLIPSAQWNKTLKQWEFPCHEYVYRQIRATFKIQNAEIEHKLNTMAKVNIKKYKFKTKPFQHQLEGVEFLLKRFGIEVME